MFFQPSHYYHNNPHHHHPQPSTSSWRRQRELDTRENELLEARDRLAQWARELQSKEAENTKAACELQRREEAALVKEQELERDTKALQRRVAVLDAADEAQAAAAREVLMHGAANVIQLFMRRLVAKRKAQVVVEGLRVLSQLERELKAVRDEFRMSGNRLLLEHTLTKLLETADAISTRGSRILRSRRKNFVRRVMTNIDDDAGEADDECMTSSNDGQSGSDDTASEGNDQFTVTDDLRTTADMDHDGDQPTADK